MVIPQLHPGVLWWMKPVNVVFKKNVSKCNTVNYLSIFLHYSDNNLHVKKKA